MFDRAGLMGLGLRNSALDENLRSELRAQQRSSLPYTRTALRILHTPKPKPFAIASRERQSAGYLHQTPYMKNVALTIFTLTTALCRADLFDNEAQLAVKYGRPVQMAGDSRFYRWEGIYVAVQLKDTGQGFKVSVSEAHKREDAASLTPSDIEKCLPSPTTGGKWIKRSDTEWQLGNKPIVARLVEEGTMIILRRADNHRRKS